MTSLRRIGLRTLCVLALLGTLSGCIFIEHDHGYADGRYHGRY